MTTIMTPQAVLERRRRVAAQQENNFWARVKDAIECLVDDNRVSLALNGWLSQEFIDSVCKTLRDAGWVVDVSWGQLVIKFPKVEHERVGG